MSTMAIATVELVRTGCDPVEVLVDQLTPTAVGNLFGVGKKRRNLIHCVWMAIYLFSHTSISFFMQLDPLTLWLKEEFGQKAFFPNSANTSFAFSPDVGDTIKSLVVEGMGTRSVRSQSPLVMNSSSSTPANRSARASSSSIASDCTPFFRSLKQPSANVKVFQAKVSKTSTGKLMFDKVGQAFIDVTESTANVLYITSVVQRKWGKGYKLVTGDGLTIDDSSGTQGIIYIKMFNIHV